MKLPALTLNQKLAIVAVALGALALFSVPHRGPVVTLDTRELALIVEKEVDHVTPSELAGWIVQGRSDYRLIDLRAGSDYAAYHIPTAENVTVAALPDFPFLRNEKIVLYSDGGIHAAQAWMLMQAQGYRAVYTVLGGLEGWKDDVLYPVLPAQASVADRARFERAVALSRFFGGEPRAEGAAVATTPVELPKLTAPAPAPSGTVSPVAPRKKKKEGC
jgi:rhodanese-related sulfurtransferase